MGQVVELTDLMPHITVDDGPDRNIIPVDMVRKIANGVESIHDVENPEAFAKALAACTMAWLNSKG